MKLQISFRGQSRLLAMVLAVLSLALVGLFASASWVRGDAFLNDDPPHPCDDPQTEETIEETCFNYLSAVRGTDWGNKWTRVGKPVTGIERFYSVAVCQDHLLAGSDRGVYSLTTPATDWTLTQQGITAAVTDVAFVPDDCDLAYAAILGHGVMRGEFANNTWVWERVDKDDQLNDARSIAIVGDSAATAGIYAAGNFGVKWLPALPDEPVTWERTTIESLTISLTPGNTLLATVWTSGVFQTSLGGWARLGSPGSPADTLVYRAAFDGSRGLVGTQSGAFLWENGDWQRIPSIIQTGFAVVMDSQALFVGQRIDGVVGSRDGGVTWYKVGKDLGGVGELTFQVRDLYIHTDGTLYAATTTGVWKWTEPQSPVDR